jgi:DNA-binding beta-propeller fold protein YncE
VRREDGQPILIRLDTNWLAVTELGGILTAPASIAVSPLGTTAAFYNPSSGIVQVVRGLPENPEVFREFDARVIPGWASQIAISDDGSCVLMIFKDSDESALWILNSAGALWRFGAVDPSSVQFFARGHDAILADTAGHEIFVLKDVDETAILIPLISFEEEFGSLPVIAASEDGLIVVMAQARSGRTTVIDVQTGTQTVLQCECDQSGLFRMRENALFQLNEVSERPLMLLDASSTEPRIILIPTDPVLLNSNPPDGEEQ